MGTTVNWRKWKNGYSTMPEMQTSPSRRACDYDDKAECAETIAVDEVAQPRNEPSRKEED